MTSFYTLTKVTTKLITTAGTLALIAGISISMAPQAYAYDCLLDTNNDGNADSNIDTDSGADSGGNPTRLACGSNASATGGDSTAVGASASAVGVRSTALGASASAAEADSTALGRAANAAGLESTAVGRSASAGGSFSTAVGRTASAGGLASVALGHSASAAGQDSTALGRFSSAAGGSSTALGVSASAAGSSSTALGRDASAGGLDSTALGRSASAAGNSSTALGRSASAAGIQSTALGQGASAAGEDSTALGRGANAAGNESTALGTFAATDLAGTTSVGYAANSGIAVGAYSTALGYWAQTQGTNAIAIGADGDGNFLGASAAGNDSIVIGTDAMDGAFSDAIVIGFAVRASEAGQIILGGDDIFTILGNGNMGLGTATPAGNLDINSGGAVDTTLLLSNTVAQWELKSKATTGRLNFKNLIAGGVPFKLGPTAVNALLSVGTATDDLVEVRGDLDVTGILTTGGPTCGGGCDAVFDDDYDLPTIEEHAALMFANKHLPEVGPTIPHAPINISEQYGRMLNELEKAHIYIAELNEEKRVTRALLATYKTEVDAVNARLAALEKTDVK